MKIRLLLAFIALSLASCSSDDDSGSDPSANNGEKKLREIIQTHFNDDGSVKTTSKTYFDDNDKATQEELFDGTGELISTHKYTYNKGVLENMAYYTASTSIEIPEYSHTIGYDNSGRIANLNASFKYNGSPATSVATYQYNPNSTIVMTRNFSYGGSATATYDVNTTGLIYKISDTAGSTELVTYNGQNMLNYSNGASSSAFVFDNEHTPKGQQHKTIVNLYNGNVNNALMLQGFGSISLGNTAYAIQQTDNNGDKYDYEYEFDDNNYPIKIRCFKNESSIPYFIREVYYK